MFKTTMSRLALAFLGYVILIILFLTLTPFYLSSPRHFRLDWTPYPDDVVINVFLFLPFGFLYRLTTNRQGAWLFGALFSIAIELVQFFIPARTTSAIDVLSNTLGAGLGARLYDLLAARLTFAPKMIGRLRFETPLMGFIYLLIPLLWISSLALAESTSRWPLTLLIGLCGAIIFNDIYRHWLDSLMGWLTLYVSLSTGIWFLFGIGPSLLRSSLGLWIMLIMVLVAAIFTLVPRQYPDRRFERASLRLLLPVFILYIVLLALWPINRPFTAWHGIFGLTDRIWESEWQALLPRSEYLVAFSILGYFVAEWRGRAELTITRDLPGLLAVVGGSALVLEIVVGFRAGPGASVMRFVLVTSAALYGGVIYHLLREHIRFLWGSGK